ncbi:hypothetical protein [Campylobacter suis]|uniref:DnaT DNA-binding domain-containing protein n=1 Tax=Campylobacter suis TaxID=2790657 RepID=A0ABN7KBD5_9BACT|nr:hypothetical protein [Campylobacter suis]CAD7288250.1 hypothetical protein LMG8286_01218 [Campylobacter suis]
MNNQAFLRELNAKIIAFYPLYAKYTGSITAGLLLSQIIYCFSSLKRNKIFKTDAELRNETMLSIDELKSAKRKLKECPFLTISVEGLPAKTFYEINWEKYYDTMVVFANEVERSTLNNNNIAPLKKDKENAQNGSCDSRQCYGGNSTNPDVENPPTYYTENTTENLSENSFTHAREENQQPKIQTKPNTPVVNLPDFLDPEFFDDYMQYLQEKGWRPTTMELDMKFRDWRKWHNEGVDVNKAIERCMSSGYRSPIKTKADTNNDINLTQEEKNYLARGGTLERIMEIRQFNTATARYEDRTQRSYEYASIRI